MSRLLKDPLVHFLLIGAALFAVAALRGQSVTTGREQIVVTAEQVAQARAAAAALQGREPTTEELRALIEPTVRDEIMYREALALGLDVNDDEVRRRLIEKMSYLTQDLADPEPSSEEELRQFYEASPDVFTIPSLVSFDQVFFSPGSRGAALDADAAAGLAALRAGRAAAEVGDRTPLRESYDDAPREQVAVLFGDELADALFSAAPGEWSGPFRSDFGLHAVRLRGRSDARLPPYDEIAARVAEEFGAQRRREANERAYQEMRARYDVVIEQPRPAGAVIRAVRRTALLAATLCALPALAHRLSPAFFGLTETAPNAFDVQWKVSISGGLAAVLEPQVPDGCSLAERVRTYVVDDMRLQHAALVVPDGLAGKAFTVNGLAQTQTDVLLRVDYLDGTSSNQRLTPEAPVGDDPRAAERARGRAHVSRARRRAHPARHRSPAVRARAALDRERRRTARRDRHGVHRGA